MTLMASGKPKQVNPERFKQWADSLETQPARRGEPAAEYQVKHCGTKEYLAKAENGKQIWADGVRAKDARLLDAKHVGTAERSPYRSESNVPNRIRELIRSRELGKLKRYAEVIRDPGNPTVGVEIITNDSSSVVYFEEMLQELGIPGRVVLKP